MQALAPRQALITLVAVTLTAPAVAQEPSPTSLEKIVVVSTKRASTLQQVPVAVSVVDIDDLQQSQVADLKDLQFLVPSLRVTQLQTSGNTNFIIRGFGNGANNAGIEPSVGVFIDGVYRSRSASALADLPDLQRIEVLRGPQSTLFGKNASAGVINVVTAKPSLDDYSGSATLTAGEHSQLIVKGDVTGPVSESLAFSLSGSFNKRDGYFENLFNGDSLGELERFGARGQLLYAPANALEMRVIADYDELDEFCCGVANLQNGPTGAIVQSLGGQLVPNDAFAYEGYYDFSPINEYWNGGLSVQIDYDLSASMRLTSITAQRKSSRFDVADVDFTSARLIDDRAGNLTDTTIETITQELRISGTRDRLDWMVGGYFFDEEIEQFTGLIYGPDFRAYADSLSTIRAGGTPGAGPSPLDGLEIALGYPAGTFFAQGQGNTERSGLDNQAFSIFSQINIGLTDRATLTLGANYTEDDKKTFVNMQQTDVFSQLDFVQIGLAQILGARETADPGNPNNLPTAIALSTIPCSAGTGAACNPLLGLQPLQFLAPFLAYPNAVESGKTDDEQTTWTLRLAYDFSDDVNLYVGGGTGFKATSWNLSRDSSPLAKDIPALTDANLVVPNLVPGTRFAGPEASTVYELGVKARFETLAVNVAIFDQEIRGFQSNIFTGTGFLLVNAGKQSTSGTEIDIRWAPLDTFEGTLAATFLTPVFDSFPNAEGVDGPVDLSDTTPPGIHEISVTASGRYNFMIRDLHAFVRGEYIYEDNIQVIENVPTGVATRDVGTLNASFGLAWESGFEALLWGRNITNDEYLLSAFPAVAQEGSYSGYPNQPRTFGLTVRKYFD